MPGVKTRLWDSVDELGKKVEDLKVRKAAFVPLPCKCDSADFPFSIQMLLHVIWTETLSSGCPKLVLYEHKSLSY